MKTEQTNLNSNEKIIGFGEHSNPTNYSTYKNAKIISEVALSLLFFGALGTISLPLILIFPIVGIPLSSTTMIVLATSSGLIAVGALSSVVYYKGCKNAIFGVLNGVVSKIEQPIDLGKFGKCEALTCDDTMESFAWKKKLIEAAEHNIVLSGNYCGGEVFDEVLDLIHHQLSIKPDLKVVLISSDRFITKANQERIDKLHRKFERFQLVESPDIYHINPGLKKSTNHTKVLAIDDGKYFILGGSGIEDKYARDKGLGDEKTQQAPSGNGLLNWLLPRGFRDGDWVFHSGDDHGVGKRVYIESLKLALRWEGLSKLKSFATDVDLAHDFKACNSVAKKLLLEQSVDEISQHPKSTTHIADFHKSPKLSNECFTKIYCTGPEHSYNPFEHEIIERLNHAKKRIIVDHMYFHPTQAIIDALISAANRGVKITIITNGNDSDTSPIAHQIFSPRNRYNYSILKKSVDEKAKNNIEIFEFKVKKTTLHKKLIVVDDYVIAGSSNLGYKSLVTMSDHEMNFVTKNKQLADQTAKIALEVDARVNEKNEQRGDVEGYARKIDNFDLSVRTILRAARHRILAPLIG